GVRTPFAEPTARRVVQAVRAGSGEEPVLMPILGGSIPAAWFPEVLGTPVILLPTVNPDNNQHAENENLRLGNLWRGIRVFAAVMTLRP
nr:peptidase M20 [Gemmatimonadota bacterium]